MSLWILLCGVGFATVDGPVNKELSAYGLKFNRESSWTIKKNVAGASDGKKMRTLEIQSGESSIEMVFLSALTTYQADQESKTEYTSILSAYKAALTPYAGAVSRKLSCPPEYLPKDVRTEFAGQRARVLFGFASARKTFGVCNLDEAKMEFAFLTANLPGDHLVKLTAFRRKGESADLDSWKKLLADFKLVQATAGGTHGRKSP